MSLPSGVALYPRLIGVWPVPITRTRITTSRVDPKILLTDSTVEGSGGPGDHHKLLKGSNHASRLSVFVLIRKLP